MALINWFRKLNIAKIILFFLVIVCLSGAFYLMCGNVSFGETPLEKNSFWNILILGIGVGFLLVVIITISALKMKYKPNIPLVAILGILLITNLVTTLCMRGNHILTKTLEDGSIAEYTYFLGGRDAVSFSIQFFGVLVTTYLVVDIIPKLLDGLTMIYVLCLFAIAFSFWCLIYSYCNETEFYTSFFFKLKTLDPHFVHPKSIFPNKNSYCVILFIGMVASLFLEQRKGHWWWFIPATYLLFSILMSFCKALTIAAPIFYLLFLMYRCVITFRKHILRNIFAILGVSAFIGLCVSSVFIYDKFNEGFLKYFKKVFIDGVPGSFDSRVTIWKDIIQLLFKYNWATGLGYHNNNYMTYTYIGNNPVAGVAPSITAHNIAMEVVSSGGIIFACAYLFVLIYFLICCFKIMKKHCSISLFAIIVMIASFGNGVVESGSFIFPFTFDYAFLSAVSLTPVITLAVQRKREKLELKKGAA